MRRAIVEAIATAQRLATSSPSEAVGMLDAIREHAAKLRDEAARHPQHRERLLSMASVLDRIAAEVDGSAP